ncbi:uncharacterized protein LOC144434815 [Glandiceps talaboti]
MMVEQLFVDHPNMMVRKPLSFILMFLYLLTCHHQVSAVEPRCKVFNKTSVDCVWRDLELIPNIIPPFTTYLDLSHNSISQLPPKVMAHLQHLGELRITTNRINSIGSDSLTGLHSLQLVDFHDNKITKIDVKAFRGLSKLEYLDVSENFLTIMPDELFSDLQSLKVLNLSKNYIATVVSPSFNGLSSLQTLHIEDNRLTCFPSEALHQLMNIESINLNGNRFSSDCIIHLPNFPQLRKLSLARCQIDDATITNMKLGNSSLNELDISGNSFTITADTFHSLQIIPKLTLTSITTTIRKDVATDGKMGNHTITEKGLPVKTSNPHESLHLEELNILGPLWLLVCNVTDPTFDFMWLPNLKVLNIKYSQFDLANFGPLALGSFKNRQLAYKQDGHIQIVAYQVIAGDIALFLSNISTLNYLHLDRNRLEGEIPFQPFTELYSLIELTLSHNQFISVHPNSFSSLSRLERLDLSHNNLYQLQHAVFASLTELKRLDLSQNRFTTLPNELFSSLKALKLLDLSHNLLAKLPPATFSSLTELNVLYIETKTLDKDFTKPTIHPLLLKNLTNLSELILYSDSVEFLSLADVPSLQYFKIVNYDTNSPYQYIDLGVIQRANLTNLKTLDISVLNLSYSGSDKQPLNSVLELHLNIHTWNGTTEDKAALLQLFPNLEILTLNITSVSSHLKSMDILADKSDSLQVLSLRSHQIQHINVDMLKSLPKLTRLDLGNNTFDCSRCYMRSFTDWLASDRMVKLESHSGFFEDYSCVTPATKKGSSLLTLEFGWECGNIALIVSLPITSFFIFVAVVITLCVRFRWYTRYAVFLLKLKLGGYQRQVNVEEGEEPLNKNYDAFVVYNQHDRPWVMDQLLENLENIDPPNFKLCIHERDFLGGRDIFDNILDSIENSHKTMLILSPHFAESEWCYFEMRMAQNHLFEQKKDLLILVLLQEIPDDVMPRVLRKILTTKGYIKWSNNAMARRLFWKKLKVALKAGARVNRVADF